MAILSAPDMGDASHGLGYESDVFDLLDEEAEDRDEVAADASSQVDELTEAAEARAEEHGDIVDAVNGRRSLRSRYDPLELGLHDGLANVPTVDSTPPAIGLLQGDERERRLAIFRLQDERRLELQAEVVRRELDVELAGHRLDEAMFRLGLRHPMSFDAGYFDDAVAAREAVIDLRDRFARSEEEGDDGEGEPGDVPAPPTVEASPPSTKSPVKATMEQRVAASRELGWSIKPRWFWAGSLVLFAAEFPFTKAVVRQLLLEPDPPELLQYVSTLSITVGFLIATKMTGLLLRRAQSMFLLASLIDPQRRPIVARTVSRIRRRSAQGDQAIAMDPTEQGLRFGAWGRLAMATVLFTMLLITVFSIADYRSDAAEALAAAERAQSSSAFDEPGAGADAGPDLAEVPDVDPLLLQQVFVAVSLLNVIGAVILAWAATDGTHDVVGEDDEPDEPGDEGEARSGESAQTSRRIGRSRPRRRRRSAAVRLQDAVERRRESLKRRVIDLEGARSELRQHDEATRTLVDLSKAKLGLDERAYWWANLAGRRFTVDADTERRLSEGGGPFEPPDAVIDLREQP